MESGEAESVTVGVDGGGAPTETNTERVTSPPAPVQVRVKVLSAVNVDEVELPDVLRVSDQAPDAAQALTFCELQLSETVPP